MEEEKSIKEILELLEALKLLGVTIAEASKDGFDLGDFSKVLDLVKDYQVLLEGFKGLGDIGGEFKDLKIDEALIIGEKTFEIYKAIRAAL